MIGDGRMLEQATLTIDLAKIEANARRVCEVLPGIEVIGVTKVTCAAPEIARAMLAGGVRGLGESRLENIEHLKSAGVPGPYWLLRSGPPSLAEKVVRLSDVSLESELVTVEALDRAARDLGRRHSVLAMVDVGDLREGMMPAEVPRFVESVEALRNIDLLGLGTSLTCYGSVVPSEANLGLLAALASEAEHLIGRELLVSGGSSTSLELLAAGRGPSSVDNVRIGEAIVLGVDPSTRERILGLHTDALTLSVPVIECKVKPSLPIGEMAQDAFGSRPTFEDRGERMRAICALGRQDAPPTGLTPIDERLVVLGASSDHVILDVGDVDPPPRVGDVFDFRPSYAGTLALFTSPYVRKVFV